ncbi:MAG: hypothetical protein EBR88_01715 [Betaproteobacteria bacterium]|nr:hypothetical protein [Betaproteobacteria bacterium]NBX73179.1 hypothetical protein [Alphaproteobacteria bacterium]
MNYYYILLDNLLQLSMNLVELNLIDNLWKLNNHFDYFFRLGFLLQQMIVLVFLLQLDILLLH